MLSSPRAVQLACDLDAELCRPGVCPDGQRGQADPSYDGEVGSTLGESTNREHDDPSSPERDGR